MKNDAEKPVAPGKRDDGLKDESQPIVRNNTFDEFVRWLEGYIGRDQPVFESDEGKCSVEWVRPEPSPAYWGYEVVRVVGDVYRLTPGTVEYTLLDEGGPLKFSANLDGTMSLLWMATCEV